MNGLYIGIYTSPSFHCACKYYGLILRVVSAFLLVLLQLLTTQVVFPDLVSCIF